jgi:hypothetical protein
MFDDFFLKTLSQKLKISINNIYDGKIEGASVFRDLCKLFDFMLSIDCEIYNFQKEINEVGDDLNKSIINNESIRFVENFTKVLNLPIVFTDFLQTIISEKCSNLNSVS